MHRLFVAIRPPEPVRDLLIDAMDAGADFRWQDEAQLHITLARWKGRRTREIADFIDRTRGLASDRFDVDRFVLFESHLSRHGAHYEEVAAYPLD